ncbi:hypothetical protein A3Q33_17165 [Colwellia sp. PAMC 21821]|nr:hypothetical protein A3Q33_17165 [Colwellia sp. PAMC 21821]
MLGIPRTTMKINKGDIAMDMLEDAINLLKILKSRGGLNFLLSLLTHHVKTIAFKSFELVTNF